MHFEFAYFYFFLIHLELTINTFIHARSSFENHTRFQTKMGKMCTRFQTKKAQKPYPLGRHINIWLIYGCTPPPPPPPSKSDIISVYRLKPSQRDKS